MKKNLLYLILAGCTFFFGACNDDNPFTPVQEIQIGMATVDFQAIGGEGSIEVAQSVNGLKASSNESWLIINNCDHGKVQFTVEANHTLETRTAVITLTGANASRQVGITQMGAIAQYDTTPLFTIFNNQAFKQFVRFKSDLPIETSISEGDDAWLKLEEAEGGFYISGTENTETPEREASVTLTSGSMKQTYVFFQYSALSFLRVWDIHYLDAEGAVATDQLTISPFDEEEKDGDQKVLLSIEKLKYQFKGVIDNGSIKIACGQSVGKMNKYDLQLAVRSTTGELGIDPSIAFRLTPTMLENGQWGLTVAADESWNREIQSLAIWAVENGQPAGFVQMFSNFSMAPASEVIIPIETIELNLADVNEAKRMDIRDPKPGECYVKITADNWNTELALDFIGNANDKELVAGTYTVSNNNQPFTIGPKSYLDKYKTPKFSSAKFKSGSVKVSREGKEYIFVIDLITTNDKGEDKQIIGNFRHEIKDMAPAIETIELNLADVNEAKRMDIRDPKPGECYVKITADNWNTELALDFIGNANDKELVAGTYTVSNDNQPFTIGPKSYLDKYKTPKFSSAKFKSGSVKVSREGKEYIFVIDLITTNDKGEEKQIIGNFRHEIKDMLLP